MLYVKPYDTIHDAIINEIIVNDLEGARNDNALETLFYYLIEKYSLLKEEIGDKNVYYLQMNDNADNNSYAKTFNTINDLEILLDILLEDIHFKPKLATDLYILLEHKKDKIRRKIYNYYNTLEQEICLNEEDVIVPMTKCLLVDPLFF